MFATCLPTLAVPMGSQRLRSNERQLRGFGGSSWRPSSTDSPYWALGVCRSAGVRWPGALPYRYTPGITGASMLS